MRPDQDAATVLATLQSHPAAAVTSATLLVAAAAPLTVLSAATASAVSAPASPAPSSASWVGGRRAHRRRREALSILALAVALPLHRRTAR